MLSKKIIIPAVIIATVGIVTLGAISFASAQGGTTPLSGLAQAIAQKFNLNQSDVQNTISQYVQQGKITSEQEQAILDEQAKLKSEYNMQSLKNMTPAQRQQTVQNMKNEITAWAQSQGIDPSYI